MIDIKFLRENPDVVKENIKKKFQNHKLVLVDEVIDLDIKNRQAMQNGDNLRAKRKQLSNEIGNLMKQGQKDEAEKREISLPEFIRRAVTVYLSMVEKYNARKSKLQEIE